MKNTVLCIAFIALFGVIAWFLGEIRTNIRTILKGIEKRTHSDAVKWDPNEECHSFKNVVNTENSENTFQKQD